MDSNHRS